MCIKLSQKKFTIDNVNKCKLYYQLILKNYLNNLISKDFAKHTIETSSSDIKKFFRYLRQNNIFRLSKITNENIFNYIFFLDKNTHSQATKSGKVSRIRTFLRFAYIKNYTQFDFSIIVPKVKINHNAILHRPVWTQDEVKKILETVDTSTSSGKRDYAILILISHLGLRFCDIKNLKFENINWQTNIINISQSKTNKFISLPLTNSVGNAIIDYIKNGRPNVDLKYIFLTDENLPFTPKDTLLKPFKKYLQLAGIDISNKRNVGIYTLRHSLATTLLQKRTPLSTISSILGHTDINNTAIYIKIDVNSLRECCLDLGVF